MDDIVLKGDELKYWKRRSDLIEVLAEKDTELILSRDLFPNFDDDDWNFNDSTAINNDINNSNIINIVILII